MSRGGAGPLDLSFINLSDEDFACAVCDGVADRFPHLQSLDRMGTKVGDTDPANSVRYAATAGGLQVAGVPHAEWDVPGFAESTLVRALDVRTNRVRYNLPRDSPTINASSSRSAGQNVFVNGAGGRFIAMPQVD